LYNAIDEDSGRHEKFTTGAKSIMKSLQDCKGSFGSMQATAEKDDLCKNQFVKFG
jgi:hypothetical protein